MWTLAELLVALAVLSTAIYYFLESRKAPKNLPPGPRGFPIVGHLPLFGDNPAKKFLEWKETYGPVFSVRFGSVQTVVLNDSKSIREAFNKEEFSGRPRLPVLIEATGGGINGIPLVDGPEQVEQRRFVIKTLKEHCFGKSSFEFRMDEEILKFVSSLKAKTRALNGKPMGMNRLLGFCVTNSFYDAMMGQRFDQDDPTLLHLIQMMDAAVDTNGSVVAQFFWFFPWIAKAGSFIGFNPPLKGFRAIYDFIRKDLEQRKSVHVKGEPKNFTDAYFDKVAETTDVNSSFHEAKSKEQQPTTIGDLFQAAIVTTVTTMDWLMIYMANDQKMQQKLQLEIETVIGTDGSRNPTLSDRNMMPYTEAVLNEILRISSLVPLGMFHRTVQSVNFQGYQIPKDTMVISNLYAVNHDTEIWKEPAKFNPERFLDEDGKVNKLAKEILAFGIGKRSCLGEGYARDQLFLLITNFFQQFSVFPVEGQSPSLDFKFGLVSSPNEFSLHVKERYV